MCNEDHIADSIVSGRLAGYATDVLSTEFIDIKMSPIFKLAQSGSYNIIITPHVGGMTQEGQELKLLTGRLNHQFT